MCSFLRFSVASAALAAACAVATPGFAQSAAPEAGAGSEPEAIIVTAQKREQDILEVPAAVSVINSAVLNTAQVTQFSDITRVSPSLTVNEQGNSASSSVSIRGIGTFSFSTSTEPAVSIVVDGVALLQQGQAFGGGLNDIAQVEVLRGPQDSLFGKNASAGVVNITTKNPTRDLSGYVEGVLTNDDETRVSAMLSGPIGQNAGFRLNGFYSDREGYINNLTNGHRLNGAESYGFGGKFTYGAGNLDLTLSGNYSNTKSNGNAPTYYYVTPGATQNGAAIDLRGIRPGVGNDNVRFDGDPRADSFQYLLSAKADLDLGFATLTSVSAYQRWKLESGQDLDFSAAPTLYQGGPYDATMFSQELRLTSRGASPFEYMVGLFYADGNTDRRFIRSAPSFLSFLRQDWDSTASTESYAAFGQLGYNFTPTTKLTLGGRVNRETVGVFFRDNRLATPVVYEDQRSDTAVTGKASLQQFVSDEVMVYAAIAKGYKGQAYDISSGFNQSRIDNLVKPEHSVSYEVGMKGRFWGNRGSFAITGFWTDYDDFQAQSAEFIAGAPQFILKNVGKLRTKGIEFEGSIRATPNLNLYGSAAYVDAKIREFPGASCYPGQTVAQGCVAIPGTTTFVQDLAGVGLANSPDFKFNVGGVYEAPIQGTEINAYMSANYAWQDDVNFSLDRNPLTKFDAYGIANASIGLRSTGAVNWDLSFFVNNLFNKAYLTSITDYTGNGYSAPTLIQQVPRNYQRYVGVRLRVGFGASN
ncbi:MULTISPECIES: TonB-dependent receptor [Sphingobium]|uniref:TonB-dependent receptor n=1 Tax=Sphingobium TaxID=165695 RepID=UPI0015EB47DB|nr:MULTISPECIES: TonB-dependent receptor [Sphingobium]MCW2363009.1 iron complex outermembrane receptor protein [Sphingobium sp. B10D3B]MCW2400311.1 iron complex outermembrane receptor protein [Sphingobium sp. B10D7B]MCW2407289.1 iron complex outermembrane receptor protein [Sphingobium xanthum]